MLTKPGFALKLAGIRAIGWQISDIYSCNSLENQGVACLLAQFSL